MKTLSRCATANAESDDKCWGPRPHLCARRLLGGGYEELLPESEPLVLVDGTTTQVARLDAIVRSKEAADREKDRRALPYLRALLDQV